MATATLEARRSEFDDVSPSANEGRGLIGASSSSLTKMAACLLALGVFWRVVRYFLQFPIWGDEAMVAINFVVSDYAGLTRGLLNCQIAPLLFLWGEKAALEWLGPDVLSLRLLPFAAGVGGLLLYCWLASLMLSGRARLFAVGFLAVAIWPVSMGTVIKPYSTDLLMSSLLLALGVRWLKEPTQTRWLVLLTLATPLALLGSYPTLFVAGSLSVALLPTAWRTGWQARGWFAGYNLGVLAGFAAIQVIGNNLLNANDTRAGMAGYWGYGFPPSAPLEFCSWFLLLLTGQMTAYPVGASNGGSAATTLLCLVGAVCWLRQRRFAYVALLTVPILLNLIAAGLHKYPFGASCRLSQHLAPGICVLAGLGAATLLDRARWPEIRKARWTTGIFGVFLLIGVIGLVRDVVHPYRDDCCLWMESAMTQMREATGSDAVVVCGPLSGMEAVFAWYWLVEGQRVTWDYGLPAAGEGGTKIWGFYHGQEADGHRADGACRKFANELRRQDAAWQLDHRVVYDFVPRRGNDPPHHCELFCFRR